ncbi:hypothetical protein SGRIM128S_06889 [Streptomyces griseomycini]
MAGTTGTPGTPRVLRAMNDRAALDLLLEHGPLSRTRIGALTGLSKPTASQLLARLEAAGLVVATGTTEGRPGPGARLYGVNPAAAHVAGLDVAPGRIRAAVADVTGRTVGRHELPTPSRPPPRRPSRRPAASPTPWHGAVSGGGTSPCAGPDRLVLGTPGRASARTPAWPAMPPCPHRRPGPRRRPHARRRRTSRVPGPRLPARNSRSPRPWRPAAGHHLGPPTPRRPARRGHRTPRRRWPWVCGAGINCVGMHPDGRTARFPALGRISGDWGGGWALAEEALWYAARAQDGRGAPTALARALPAHFGLPDMPALVEALHLRHVPPPRRHELTPVLFATAADGDPVARAIVDRQADEVVTMATVALTRLGLLDEETPVLLGGSVLAAGHPQLADRVRTLLADRAPKAVPRVVTAAPVLGAALLGLDRLAAPPESHHRLRAHFGT